jgi:ketosteroid isomerase-like protein
MSQDVVDIARGAYDAINRGEGASLLGLVHEDMTFREPASLPYGGIHRGPEGLGKLFGALAEHWDDLHLEAEEILDAGDCAVIRGRLQGRSKRTATEVDEPYLEILRFRDGKLAEGVIQMHTARVLGALGREPEPAV